MNLSSSAGSSLARPVTVRVGGHRLDIGGAAPKAPGLRTAAQLTLEPGRYRVTVASISLARLIQVRSGQASPILIGVDGGRVGLGSVWIGTEDSSLGLNELQGALKPMPQFALVDQLGAPFGNAALFGRDTVIAAFDTSCRASCPIYAGLFFELRRLDPAAQLVEVSVDAARDTPADLSAYRSAIGADWTFAGGPAAALSAFWGPLGVALASGDLVSPTLIVVDPHGYVQATFQGLPALSPPLPEGLRAQLDSAGLSDLNRTGNGWGATQVLAALTSQPAGEAPPAGGSVPAFTLPDSKGRLMSLAAFRGRPVLLNFWRSDCVPCQQEMPLLVKAARTHRHLALVLIDEGQNAATAAGFARQQGFTGEVLLDASSRVGVSYHVVGYPTSFFLRSDGTLEGEFPGALTPALLNSALGAIGA